MDGERRHNRGAITRSSVGPSAAEAFTIIAIATVLITRLSIGLFTLAILSYHLDLAASSEAPVAPVTAPSGTGS